MKAHSVKPAHAGRCSQLLVVCSHMKAPIILGVDIGGSVCNGKFCSSPRTSPFVQATLNRDNHRPSCRGLNAIICGRRRLGGYGKR